MKQTGLAKARSERHYLSRKDHIKNRVRIYQDAVKKEVLSHYSVNGEPKCLTCSVSEIPKLSLDHINNDGREHRDRIKRPGNGMYRWVRKNGFPPIFQVLCHNCNHKKHANLSRIGESYGCEYKRRIKKEVFSYYSNGIPSCKRCGETDIIVLTMDHVNNDGGEHRKSLNLKMGYESYAWLRKNGFPDGFQVLCFNCNVSKEILRGRILSGHGTVK